MYACSYQCDIVSVLCYVGTAGERERERAGWMIVERLDIRVRGGMEKDHGRSMFAF